MDTTGSDILDKNFNLRVKPAEEYRQGEKVILVRDVNFDICILAGTECILTEIGKQGKEIGLTFNVFGKRWVGSVDDIDSLENGQGELFRTFHDWVPWRKVNEGQGWILDFEGHIFRAKLDDGTIVEGRLGGRSDDRVLTTVSIGSMEYPADRIQNLAFKKGSHSVAISIGGVESNYYCLLDELINIWVKYGAYTTPTGTANKRVVDIGNAFYTTGGMDRMQSAARTIRELLGGSAVGRLDKVWHGIGPWRA